jgi:hypothetical protein
MVRRVAQRYRDEGYDVQMEPSTSDLPFDVGGYRPDLLAVRGDEHLMIEVKLSSRHEPPDRLVEVADTVRQHPQWRFLLVTSDDVARGDLVLPEQDLPTWSDLRGQLENVQQLEANGAHASALLITWSLMEGILRRHSWDEHLPIHRLPTSALIKQMYSLGELSAADYDSLLKGMSTRNEAAHGFVPKNAHESDATLRAVATSLLEEWQVKGSGVEE